MTLLVKLSRVPAAGSTPTTWSTGRNRAVRIHQGAPLSRRRTRWCRLSRTFHRFPKIRGSKTDEIEARRHPSESSPSMVPLGPDTSIDFQRLADDPTCLLCRGPPRYDVIFKSFESKGIGRELPNRLLNIGIVVQVQEESLARNFPDQTHDQLNIRTRELGVTDGTLVYEVSRSLR